jgi:hypothetical protein
VPQDQDDDVVFDANWFAIERNTNATRAVVILLLSFAGSTLVSAVFFMVGFLAALNADTANLTSVLYVTGGVTWFAWISIAIFRALLELQKSRDYREVQ